MCRPERSHVPWGGLVALAVAGAVSWAVVWLLVATPFLPVAAAVLSVACVAGTTVAVRNVVRDRGLLWRAPTESLLLKALKWRPARTRKRAVVLEVRPELSTSVAPLAIEAPKPPLTGVVLERGEVVAAGLAEAGDLTT